MAYEIERPEHLTSLIKGNPYVTEYYRVLFNRCDKNKDGFVNMVELKRFVEMQEQHDIPEHVIKAIYGNFDKDGDARLDFDEFLEMINSPVVIKVFKRMRSRYLQFVLMTPKTVHLESTFTSTGLYEREQTCGTHTIGMLLLSIVQIILFYINLYYVTSPDGKREPQSNAGTQAIQNMTYPTANLTNGPLYDALMFSRERRYEIWRYVTYIFVHANEMHLFPNVVIQIIFGVPLEMVHTWRVVVIYFAGALGGCLGHGVFMKADLVGGSGGVYAFYTAHIATVIMNWREMSHPSVHLIIFGLLTIFDPIYNSVIMDTETSKVSYITHLGGAVVGLLLGIIIVRNLKVTRNENVIWYTCLVIYVILMIAFLVLNIFIVK